MHARTISINNTIVALAALDGCIASHRFGAFGVVSCACALCELNV